MCIISFFACCMIVYLGELFSDKLESPKVAENEVDDENDDDDRGRVCNSAYKISTINT